MENLPGQTSHKDDPHWGFFLFFIQSSVWKSTTHTRVDLLNESSLWNNQTLVKNGLFFFWDFRFEVAQSTFPLTLSALKFGIYRSVSIQVTHWMLLTLLAVSTRRYDPPPRGASSIFLPFRPVCAQRRQFLPTSPFGADIGVREGRECVGCTRKTERVELGAQEGGKDSERRALAFRAPCRR